MTPCYVRVIDEMADRATPPLLRRLNERAVLEAIRLGAPISRAEISRRAGISKPTVSVALQTLLDAGLVRESGSAPHGPNYGAVYFEAVPDAALVLGLDLGARFLRGAICDLRGEVRARQDLELRAADVDEALTAVAGLRDALVEASGLDAALIDSVVVGVPGVVETQTGRLSLAANVQGLEGRPLADDLAERLGLPISLENDINLAALGEHWAGVARGVPDFVFLSIGTGMGAGLVFQGEVHRGHHGAAGEVDFALFGLGSELDPSGPAISALAAELGASRKLTTRLVAPYDVRAIFAAARGGDALGRAVVEEEARRIALHIAPIAAVADVGLVVLGGGVGANGDLLLEPVRRLLAGWLPYPPRIETSSIGDAAVLMGALAVGLRAALDNVFSNRERAARVSG
jgi:predicted NBD/HSP70 family sugar kinase